MRPTYQLRRRKKAPSEAEWERIRPKFERLYIRERLTLPRISAILARDHNFHAAAYMYKHRISKWGLKKSFKLEELEAAASVLGYFARAGLNPPTAMIDNRKVPLERVKRHFKASFGGGEQLSSSRMMIPFQESSGRDCRPVCAQRTTQKKLGLQRRSQTVPRVLLQQSAESHLLESTLAAINNYFPWRLDRSDEYFVAQKHGAREHAETFELLDPQEAFFSITMGVNAVTAGAYHRAQSHVRQFCGQARVLLGQQHPLLLEALVFHFKNAYIERAGQFINSIISYLAALASRLLGHDHPILLTLRLLSCYEARGKGSQLVIKLLYEIMKRQKDTDAESIFELEYYMATASVDYDDFHTAAESCQGLLRRYMDRLDQRHIYCRRLMYLQGELHWKHDFPDKAKQILLKVLELDDFYASHAGNPDWISLCTMQFLGRICESTEDLSTEDLSGAEKWYRQAYEASCKIYGVEDGDTQYALFRLSIVERRLSETGEHLDEDQIDVAEIFEDLEKQIEELKLDESPAEGEREARAAPWNDWQADVPDANESSHTSTDGSTYEDDSPDATSEGGNEQMCLRAISGDASHDLFLEGELACDAINTAVQVHEKKHDPASSLQCLRVSAVGTVFDPSNDVDLAFDLSSCSAADPYINPAAALFGVSDLPSDASTQAFIATQTQSSPQEAQDTTIADLCFNALPPLKTGPEFDEFDNIKATDMVELDTMILDTDGNSGISNPGFFDCSNTQAWHALDGHDAVNNQEPDIFWGDLMFLEEEQSGV
ncbi:hypothetical protein G647_00257 [Cladophialophora carrionii CBS 160.54]|uniref:Clr5 domain-containing protein n=1 Tax=Cladophialophora carrionii CBS 160.54 TaxID=1279043 RepID=V9DNB0_9EURO|nr:uncharacterized protein G647_00257 [Cladophialophora carrionii CBS 160.54]ETI27808.1 hypothetical protein G647_00257 [Cladophialophora carrionii CBS 160.54]